MLLFLLLQLLLALCTPWIREQEGYTGVMHWRTSRRYLLELVVVIVELGRKRGVGLVKGVSGME